MLKSKVICLPILINTWVFHCHFQELYNCRPPDWEAWYLCYGESRGGGGGVWWVWLNPILASNSLQELTSPTFQIYKFSRGNMDPPSFSHLLHHKFEPSFAKFWIHPCYESTIPCLAWLCLGAVPRWGWGWGTASWMPWHPLCSQCEKINTYWYHTALFFAFHCHQLYSGSFFVLHPAFLYLLSAMSMEPCYCWNHTPDETNGIVIPYFRAKSIHLNMIPFGAAHTWYLDYRWD